MKIKLSTLDDWLKITDRQSEPSTEESSVDEEESSQNEDSQDEDTEENIEGSRSQKNNDIYDFDEKYFQSSIDLAGGKSKIRKSLPLLPAQPLIGTKISTPPKKRRNSSPQNGKENKRPRSGQLSMSSFINKKNKILTRPKHLSTPNLISRQKNSRIHLRIDKDDHNPVDQKRVTRCPECDFLYNSKCMNSKAEHQDIHENRLNALKIRSGSILGAKWINWKSGSIYTVEDKHKCKKLESFVDEIFGKSTEKRKRNILVFVENEIQRIRGILIYSRSTESASRAILDENEDEQIIREVYPDIKSVKVVIDRLWVDYSRRRNGIASQLVNTLMNIENVVKDDICMTDPTPDGAKFGISYFGKTELLVAQ